VNGVARAVERADADAVSVETGAKVAPRGLALEQPIEPDMGGGRPIAATEFEHVHLETGGDPSMVSKSDSAGCQ
jgi:hypothetical protein